MKKLRLHTFSNSLKTSGMKLEFDTQAFAKAVFQGPFASLADMRLASSVPIGSESDHARFIQTTGQPAFSESILTTQHNPHFLARRYDVLSAQMRQLRAGAPADEVPGLNFSLPPFLVRAFAEVSAGNTRETVVLAFEGTRETLIPLLQEEFPDQKITAGLICTSIEDAHARNGLTAQGDDTQTLNHITMKDIGAAHLVFANSWLHYLDSRDDVIKWVDQACKTGADHVVLANTLTTTARAPEFWAQAYYGGYIPVRVANQSELVDLFNVRGYALSKLDKTPPTYDQNAATVRGRAFPQETQLVFSRV